MNNNKKKIVLFIVEGISDKLALGPVLSQIISSKNVKFKIIGGDITSDYYNVTLHNIVLKIKEHVNAFMGSIYKIEDIEEIIHVVDIDGAFVTDDKIVNHSSEETIYTDTNIYTQHVFEMKKRNAFKSRVLSTLSSTTSIKLGRSSSSLVPYSIYYMSCNLDHVLIDDRNLNPTLKKSKAIEFADKYFNNEEQFYMLLRSSTILKEQNYVDSWVYLSNGVNSLSRCSNFALYLDKYF